MFIWHVFIGTLLLSGTFVGAQDDTEKDTSIFLGDVYPDHQSRIVHHIPLFDRDGFRIFPGVNDDQPFSLPITCGQCHDMAIVGKGWHFSAGLDPNNGRPGEPWIYWDCRSSTQIPLSYREWPGTFRPEQIGLSDWWFVQAFGRHLPGGGRADPPQDETGSPGDHWEVSGSLSVNCMSCHDADPLHDQACMAEQIRRYNYQWAATSTCAFAYVEGEARDLLPDSRVADAGIKVVYEKSRFFADNQVMLDLRKEVPNHRCTFCHTTHIVESPMDQVPRDVHMAAGMMCVDCHEHELDHAMTRGYAYEWQDTGDPNRFALSCQGCHFGTGRPDVPDAGSWGVPMPEHKGIPTIHFEKLSCMACHSGPWPVDTTYTTKTSRAHALGTQQANRSPDSLPHIYLPVFAPGPDGRLTPHKLMWPAYWAWQKDNEISPITLETLDRLASGLFYHAKESHPWTGVPWTRDRVSEILAVLNEQAPTDSRAVYVSGGKMYSRLTNNQLIETEHQGGAPYMWPMAHHVRPAAQSLGVCSCEDCHHTDAGLLFGTVTVDGPLVEPHTVIAMSRFHGLDPTFNRLFAWTFIFRPLLKIVCLLACGVILLVLLSFGVRMVNRITDIL